MLKVTILALTAALFFPFLCETTEAGEVAPPAETIETSVPLATSEHFVQTEVYLSTSENLEPTYIYASCSEHFVPLDYAPAAKDVDQTEDTTSSSDETMLDTVRMNMLTLEEEPTLRDTVRMNMLTLEEEPTLRDTVIIEQ